MKKPLQCDARPTPQLVEYHAVTDASTILLPTTSDYGTMVLSTTQVPGIAIITFLYYPAARRNDLGH